MLGGLRKYWNWILVDSKLLYCFAIGWWPTTKVQMQWQKAMNMGSNAMVKHNEYGFTLVNFEHLIPLSTQLFAFPMHVQQVFFVDDTKDPRGWKVVLCKEPRGQRSQFTQEGNLELTLFDLGNNYNHVGMRMIDLSQPPTSVPPPNIVDAMASELITLTQILIEEMATFSNHDDDEADEPNPLPLNYEND